jgi:hypothetical protein
MLASENRLSTVRRLLCVALVLCAVICAQTVSLAQVHSHQHSYQHCCGLCHAGPLAFVPMSMGFAALQSEAVCWLAVNDDIGGALERLASRASLGDNSARRTRRNYSSA